MFDPTPEEVKELEALFAGCPCCDDETAELTLRRLRNDKLPRERWEETKDD